MPGTLVPIIITEDWNRPDGTTPTGSVRFDLLEDITAPGYVSANTLFTNLAEGAIAQQLYANDADSDADPLTPSTTQYRVTEEILGAPVPEYFITVPAVPPGSRVVADAVTVNGLAVVVSASADFTQDDVGAYVLLPQFPPGTQISRVIDGMTASLSTAANATASGVTLMVGASASLSELRYPQ